MYSVTAMTWLESAGRFGCVIYGVLTKCSFNLGSCVELKNKTFMLLLCNHSGSVHSH